jgi:hypothetical protein
MAWPDAMHPSMASYQRYCVCPTASNSCSFNLSQPIFRMHVVSLKKARKEHQSMLSRVGKRVVQLHTHECARKSFIFCWNELCVCRHAQLIRHQWCQLAGILKPTTLRMTLQFQENAIPLASQRVILVAVILVACEMTSQAMAEQRPCSAPFCKFASALFALTE